MVNVVLHKGVVRTDLVQNIQRLLCTVQVIAGNVVGVDGLNQQPQACGTELCGRISQVAHEGLAEHIAGNPCRRFARKTMELPHPQALGITDGGGNSRAELLHTVWQAGDAPLTGVPIAWGQVVEYQFEPVGIEFSFNVFDGKGVGKQKLYRREVCLGSGLKPFQKGQFGKQQGQIGSEIGHDFFLGSILHTQYSGGTDRRAGGSNLILHKHPVPNQ